MLKIFKSKNLILILILIGVSLIFQLNSNSISNSIFHNNNITDEQINMSINAVDSFKCVTMDFYYKMIKDDPRYEYRLHELEIFTKNYIKNLTSRNKNVVKIPVVIHIVYNTQTQNISNAVVQSQIDVLNKDYRRLNKDTINTPIPFKHLGGDSQIEFVLAKRDPQGHPSIGITRTQTSVITFYGGDSMKFNALGGHDIWDRDKYMNIWVCNLFYGGYSQFPGGNPLTDGNVIAYRFFGTIGSHLIPNFAKGRISTHEIGHWFNLRHIWGDSFCGDDFVNDTPVQETANSNCPLFPHITCNNGPNGDMFMNYMDYTRDDCMNIFTIGQSNRMNAALFGARSSLLTSNGGIPVSGVPIAHFRSDNFIIDYGNNVNYFDESGGIPTNWHWIFEGGVPSSSNQQNPTVLYSNPGFYNVKLKVSNSYGTDSANYVNYIKVCGVNMYPFTIVYPPTNSFIQTYSVDTTKSLFTWNKSNSHPSIKYKWNVRKGGTSNNFSFYSNNNGTDSVITLRNSFLDSLATRFEPNNDSVYCVWRVFSYNGSDSLASQNEYFFIIIRQSVGIKIVLASFPEKYKVFQNYPNPFNPSTIIRFQIKDLNFVTLKVYDVLGKEVTTLVNEKLKPGEYEVSCNGSRLPSGVYFYLLYIDGALLDTKKMILLK